MAKVQIYTQSYCPYCERAKTLLKSKNVSYDEINLDGRDEDRKNLQARTGMRTVPQIFINDELIGGYSELSALEQKGELDKKLNS